MERKHFSLIAKILLLIVLILPSLHFDAYGQVKHADIVYFYITVCEPCNEAQKEMIKISRETAEYSPNIIMYNIENTNNLELLNQYYDYYKVPKEKRHLPCVFIGQTYLGSEAEINTGLKKAITSMDTETPLLKKKALNSGSEDQSSRLKIVVPFFTGVVNGFNPCALSMLLFFISLFIAQKGNILRTGFSFCLGKFLMFLGLGTILYSFLSTVNITLYRGIVKVIALILILLVTMMNGFDYFAAKKEQYGKIRMQLPIRLRKKLNQFMQGMVKEQKNRYIILISFLTGVVIAIGEFLCTGQLYLASIVNSVREYGSFNIYAFFTLLIYDIGFILPLVVIIFAIQRGKLVFELSESLRSKLPGIKLITAGVFLIYGVIFLIFL